MRIVIMGPAHPLRGGLATFNQRLARQFTAEGHSCAIVSFSLQYPSFLFPGTTQYADDAAPEDIEIHTLINSVNPANWLLVGSKIRGWKPDIIVVRYWLPVMGPALGTILRRVKKNGHTKIICIADNVIPHEARPGDKPFTRYFIKACDGFITMSGKVLADLRLFDQHKPAVLVQHPLYDTFGEPLAKEESRERLGLSPADKILLFFGFIRKYKGLDLLLQAMAVLQNEKGLPGYKLLVAGEFYEDEKPYQQLISDNRLENVILKTSFIPDNEVGLYLSAADAVIQPYRQATQSGVTPLAYHFEKPMIVTNVGGLPALVPHGKAGIVCEPEPGAIAAAIIEFYEKGEPFFLPGLKEEKKKYAWSNLTGAVLRLANQ